MKSVYILIITGALCLSSQQLFTMYKGKHNTVNYINYNKHTSKNAKYQYTKHSKKVSNLQKNWEDRQEKELNNKHSSISMYFCTPQGRKNTYSVDPIDSVAFLTLLERLQHQNILR